MKGPYCLAAFLWVFVSGTVPAASADWPTFELQGHRGARGHYPENSLPGFAAALALGVSTLEMDVGMSADGVLMVHHDRRLDPQRTRGPGGGWIAEPEAESEPAPTIFALPRAALAAYDIGRMHPNSRLAARFSKQKGLDGVAIPTLAEVLAQSEGASNATIHYNIEIKTAPDAPKETALPAHIAAALVELLHATGTAERVTIQSFDWRALRHVQTIAPAIPTAYLTAEQSWLNNLERGQAGVSLWTAGFDPDEFAGSVPRTIKAAGGAIWSPYYRDLHVADLREARELGLRVVVWTVNDAAEMHRLIDLGVDGIITDYPDRLRAVMAERAMPLPPAFPMHGG